MKMTYAIIGVFLRIQIRNRSWWFPQRMLKSRALALHQASTALFTLLRLRPQKATDLVRGDTPKMNSRFLPYFTVLMIIIVGLFTGCDGTSTRTKNRGSGDVAAPPPAPPPAPNSETFRLSGNLTVADFMRVDGDTNDTFQMEVSNNDLTQSQPVPNPVLIKGFVAAFPTGDENERFRSRSDPFDGYRIRGFAGQVIYADIADAMPGTNDINLDLILYDVTVQAPVAYSNSVSSNFEVLTIPYDGTFDMIVQARLGDSLYTLSLTTEQPTILSAQPLISEMMLDQLQVLEQPESDLGRSLLSDIEASPAAKSESKSMKLNLGGQNITDVISSNTRIAAEKISALATSKIEQLPFPSLSYKSTNPDSALSLLQIINAANIEEGREAFAPAFAGKLHQFVPGDPTPQRQLNWNLYDIGWSDAEDLLASVSFQKRPVIAILDSGFFPSHPDLRKNLVDQRDFVPASRFIPGASFYDVGDGDGFDAEAEERATPGGDPQCHHFHGTTVATVAAASEFDGGMIGVAPEANVIGIRVGNAAAPPPFCRQIVGEIDQAILYAARLPNASNELPAVKADVINMSFGAQPSPAVQDAINRAAAEGVIIVASAGNEGRVQTNYPAAYDNVISVGATNLLQQLTQYSTRGTHVDITAPGGDVANNFDGYGPSDGVPAGNATQRGFGGGFFESYTLVEGTSFSAPTVAGGIAIMKAIAPSLTQSDFEALLANGQLTTDIAAPGYDIETGFGLMSLPKMIQAALEFSGNSSGSNPEIIVSSPSQMTFGTALSEVTIELAQITGSSTSITGIQYTDGLSNEGGSRWIELTSQSTDSDGIGTYTFMVDRVAAGDGASSGAVLFEKSDGSIVRVPVSLTNSVEVGQPETGTVFFFVDRLNTNGQFEEVEQFYVSGGATGGSVSLSIDQLPAGDYRILFGTDMDSDDSVCDTGELCGGLPFSNDISADTIRVDADQSDMEFALRDVSGVNLEIFSGPTAAASRARKIDRSKLVSRSTSLDKSKTQ